MMNTTQTISGLTEDIVYLIGQFNKYKRLASTNKTAYDYCLDIVNTKIPMLCEFAEKYLSIKIIVDHKKAPIAHSQYDPGVIQGYSINII